jgi:hypothetical protein
MSTYRSKSTKSCSFGTSRTNLNEMARDDVMIGPTYPQSDDVFVIVIIIIFVLVRNLPSSVGYTWPTRSRRYVNCDRYCTSCYPLFAWSMHMQGYFYGRHGVTENIIKTWHNPCNNSFCQVLMPLPTIQNATSMGVELQNFIKSCKLAKFICLYGNIILKYQVNDHTVTPCSTRNI